VKRLPPPSTPVRRFTTLTLGWALILLGVVGLFLPVLQGVAFILLGLYVLSRESQTARNLLRKIRERYPRLDQKLRAMRERFRRLMPHPKRAK
jgi:uncharacterized membrane protein YbaN (DUF454 family)